MTGGGHRLGQRREAVDERAPLDFSLFLFNLSPALSISPLSILVLKGLRGNGFIRKVHKKTLCTFLNVPVSPFNVPKMSMVNYKSAVRCYGYRGGYANSSL